MNLSLDKETNPEDLPLELSDLHPDTQRAYEAWSYLHPHVCPMSGVITGRDMAGFRDMCIALDIDISPSLTRLAAAINNAWTMEAQRLVKQKGKKK